MTLAAITPKEPDYVAINERGKVVRSFSHEDMAERFCLAMADQGASLTVVPRVGPSTIWRETASERRAA